MEPQIAIDAFDAATLSQHEDPPNASFDAAEVRDERDTRRRRKQRSRIDELETPSNDLDQGPRPRRN